MTQSKVRSFQERCHKTVAFVLEQASKSRIELARLVTKDEGPGCRAHPGSSVRLREKLRKLVDNGCRSLLLVDVQIVDLLLVERYFLKVWMEGDPGRTLPEARAWYEPGNTFFCPKFCLVGLYVLPIMYGHIWLEIK